MAEIFPEQQQFLTTELLRSTYVYFNCMTKDYKFTWPSS